jgi:cell division protein ZapA
MAQANQVQVTIMGRNFTLRGEEDPQYIQMLAAYVDDKLAELQKMSPRMALSRLAILAAINIADEYHKLRNRANEDQVEEANVIVRSLLDRFPESRTLAS